MPICRLYPKKLRVRKGETKTVTAVALNSYTITVTANASAGATSLTVASLPITLGAWTVLYFNSGKRAMVWGAGGTAGGTTGALTSKDSDASFTINKNVMPHSQTLVNRYPAAPPDEKSGNSNTITVTTLAGEGPPTSNRSPLVFGGSMLVGP